MNEMKMLPVGVDSFEKIRKNNYYYVDKTHLIEQIISNFSEVTLFTRPRRFGKTLNMSMLKCFFEIGSNPSLFDGLYISSNTVLCEEYMGKYPVIFLSLKSIDGLNYEEAEKAFKKLVGNEVDRFRFLFDSEMLTDVEKEQYKALIQMTDGKFTMDKSDAVSSLQLLSKLLYKHFGKKTVILIDEYDVPLDKAFNNGYYKEMVSLLRGFLGNALKTNDSLQFAVLTGCLRISKESIFTGINNFNVLSIIDDNFDEEFGFTDKEVKELLAYYHLEDKFDEMKEWYDGYHFGNSEIYCPWDVINHTYRLIANHNARPQSYWINTSGNDLVKRFIDKANKTTRNEIETLIAGKSVEKNLNLELTYEDIDSSIENLWSVLFTTGYLTYTDVTESGAYKLVIPNKEVREVFKVQIQEWFKKQIFSNTDQLNEFWYAMENGKADKIQNYLNRILSNSISVYDTKNSKFGKESSYHALLVGLLAGNDNWLVKSNVEAGEGFADIIVETDDPDKGFVIELKYSDETSGMESDCKKALKQIRDKRYDEYLKNDGITNILYYGISFCRKRSKVMTL